MPTPEEIDSIIGAEPNADTTESAEEEVDPTEYRKLAESYQNVRSLSDRKDNELHQLRKKVKELESPSSKATPLDSENDDDEDEVLRAKLIKFGFVSKEEAREQVEKEMKLMDKVTNLKKEVTTATETYPFVKEGELLTFISERGGYLSVDEAIRLKYAKELAVYSSKGSSVPTTDSGGRTLATRPTITSFDEEKPKRQGLLKGDTVQDWIARRFSQEVDKASGVR